MSTPADFTSENEASYKELRSLVGRLRAEHLRRPLGEDGWTVAAALAHLSFWERQALDRLARWEKQGEVEAASADPDEINAEHLQEWLTMPLPAVLTGVHASIQAIDARIAGLSLELVQKIIDAGRGGTLNRANHRREHLQQIEAALRTNAE